MKVTLIHNPAAGDSKQVSSAELVTLIRQAGHEVIHESGKLYWDKERDAPCDLVAVAGGDGSIGEVAARLIGQHVPLAVLPLGTANNISKTLALTDVPLAQLVAAWATAHRLPFDVGVADGPWGSTSFIESVGVGLFSRAMAKLDARNNIELAHLENAGDKISSVVQMLRERLQDSPTLNLTVTLDTHDFSGEYILLEAMNTRYVGPNLCLAPNADVSDGLLDVVLVRKGEQGQLDGHLSRQGEHPACDGVLAVQRGQSLRIDWTGFDVHIDDEIWSGSQSTASYEPRPISVTIECHALEILIPARAPGSWHGPVRRS